MSSVVGAVQDRKDRPAIVRFARRVVEDKRATLEKGSYVGKDVDYALITPPYSKDCIEMKVEQWKINMEADVRESRMPAEWRDDYLKRYAAFQNGQELPPNGTAIRGWGVISPAQQETLIRMNILTVEDLAAVNDEGLRRIGMGALDLKRKADAWLAQLGDKGPLTQKMAAIEAENDSLKTKVELLMEKLEVLQRAVNIVQVPASVPVQMTVDSISVDDILPENEPVRRKK